MATGMTEWSGAVAPTDVANQGEHSWATVSGMSPSHPLVGGPHIGGLGSFDVDRGRSQIVTLPDSGGAAAPWTGVMAGAPGVHLLDDWRDLFNFKGSPMPWLLLLALAAVGVAQLSVAGRVGPLRASAAAGG